MVTAVTGATPVLSEIADPNTRLSAEKALEESGIHADDIDLFVPHQANMRIIQSAADRIKLPF